MSLLVAVAGLGDEARAQAPTADAAAPSGPALTLEDVLLSVDEHHPLLQATLLERLAATGRVQAAFGAFDARLRAEGDLRPAGFYESNSVDVAAEQPTRWWGAEFFGGYRLGRGDVPSYHGGRLTDEDGELRVGLGLPLLRGGAIDPRRASIARAEIDRIGLEPEIELQRVELARTAAVAFWDWVASGLRTQVAERLVGVAEERQSQIERRVERGAEPPIDRVDNRRLVIDRHLQLRGAERDFRQASVDLSLFLRDGTGEPLRVDRRFLPANFPEEARPDAARFERDRAAAREEHPRLRSLEAARRRLEVDTRLARNELLPAVDLRVVGSRDLGASAPGIDERGKLSPEPRSETELRALVRFELPVQRRSARGELAVARARLAQLERRERFARDEIEARVRRAFEGLEAAYEQTGLARENLALAEELRRAEGRKLALGLGNLIDVNIREMTAAAAERELVNAQAAYFRALAAYRAALARPRPGAVGGNIENTD